jgi:hypothetical protein
MVSTVSAFDLFVFACDAGIAPRTMYPTPGEEPHYRIDAAEERKALETGALKVTYQDLVQEAWWRRR